MHTSNQDLALDLLKAKLEYNSNSLALEILDIMLPHVSAEKTRPLIAHFLETIIASITDAPTLDAAPLEAQLNLFDKLVKKSYHYIESSCTGVGINYHQTLSSEIMAVVAEALSSENTFGDNINADVKNIIDTAFALLNQHIDYVNESGRFTLKPLNLSSLNEPARQSVTTPPSTPKDSPHILAA